MRIVNRLFSLASEVAETAETIDGVLKELTAVGGAAACESYFLDGDGLQRTDISRTYAELQNLASSLAAIQTLMETHKTNFYLPMQ